MPSKSPTLDLFQSLERDLGHHKKLSIGEFAEIANRHLYPRQLLLLKLIFLEELTQEEEDVLDYWIAGGNNGSEIVISPLIRERIAWLRANDYPHFREVVLVGGRRSGKGHITATAAAYMMYNLIDVDVMKVFNIDADKSIYFSCIAASQDQAKAHQYADFAATVSSCPLMQDYIFKIRELEFSILTEYDKRRTKELEAKMGRVVGRDMSKLRGVALAANAKTVRGSATLFAALDEMAHMQQEGASYMTASQVYDALSPSLMQFGKHSLCNPPEAPIWMADLSFKQIGDIRIGDEVIGWTDSAGATGNLTKDLTKSRVINVMRRKSPIVKVTMESGRSFRCTPDHRWLTLSYGGKKDIKGHSHQEHICLCGGIYESKASFAAHIRESNKRKNDLPHGVTSRNGYYTQGREWFCIPEVGRKLVHVIDPTPALSERLQRDAAWLGGMFDGEGSANRNQAIVISHQSNHADVHAHIGYALDELGLDYSVNPKGYSLRAGGNGCDAKQMVVNFANWTQPVRRDALVAKALVGRWRQPDRIVSVEPDGYGEVVALTTTTGNYVANGYASKNCMLNSSPYTKIGKFYEKYLEAIKVVDGEPANPAIFTLQSPSWCFYQQNIGVSKKGHRKFEIASPDWDENQIDDNGQPFYSSEERAAILIARTEEQSDFTKFKVENRAQWAEVADAYLQPEYVDRAFLGRPTVDDQYDAFNVNWASPEAGYEYFCHLDPSSTTAGFGFAMGHIETFPEFHPKTGELEYHDHVIFDIIRRFIPKNFLSDVGGEMIFDYEWVLEEISHWVQIFRPVEITVDQFGSKAIIAWLSRWCRENELSPRIFEKTASPRSNFQVAERFRDALYLDRVHFPSDTTDCDWLSLELKNLQRINTQGGYGKIEAPTVGPVQSKDLFSAASQVVYSLVGDTTAKVTREALAAVKPALGAQGGYQIGGSKLQRRSLDSLMPGRSDRPGTYSPHDNNLDSVNFGNWVRRRHRL